MIPPYNVGADVLFLKAILADFQGKVNAQQNLCGFV